MTTESTRPVRVRLAPSPTGDPHVGNAYVGLFDMAFARHAGGRFVLRIEDTDQARSTEESERAIFECFRWIGLQWDEGPDVGGPYGPYRQSERKEIYVKYVQELVEKGAAYHCFCTQERLAEVRKRRSKMHLATGYDGFCRDLSAEDVQGRLDAGRPHVVRLKVPHPGETVFDDLLRGKVRFQNQEVDDQVLLKSDGFPTYHLANTVDDHLMEITHVVRGEEWISSTPKHILLYQAFGWELPIFIHMPLLRNPDKSKLSKRRNPTSLYWYRQQGYLPEALCNFLLLMGFSTGDDEEIFPFERVVERFSWDRVSKGGPVFDLRKLDWMNGEYIRRLSVEELATRLEATALQGRQVDRQLLLRITPIIQERIKKLSDFDALTDFFFTDELNYEPELLIPKKRDRAETTEALEQAAARLEAVDWTVEAIEAEMRRLCEELGWKPRDLYMPLRVAVTGKTVTPPLFESMIILGPARSRARIRTAIEKLTST